MAKMTRRLRLVLTLAALVLTYPALGRDLSLEEALAMASQHSFAWRLQNAERDKLDQRYNEALARASPQLALNSSLRRHLESPQIMGFDLNQKYETTYGVTISQAVYSFGAVTNALAAADAALKLQGYADDVVKREIIFATKLSYFAVRGGMLQLDIARKSLKNAEDNLRSLKKQFGSGRPPQGDLIRLNADVAARLPQVTSAEATLKVAKTRLKSLLGLDHAIDFTATTPLSEKKVQLDLQPANASESKLKALEQAIQVQDKIADAQWSQSMPSLGAFFNWNASRQSDAGFFSPERDAETSVVGLSLTWSIWDGGGHRARYKQALVEKMKAELELEQAREAVQTDVVALKDEIAALHARLDLSRRAIDLAGQSFAMSQRRFASGRTSVSELNDTEYLLTQARINEALVLFQLNEARAKWDRLFQAAPAATLEKEESHG